MAKKQKKAPPPIEDKVASVSQAHSMAKKQKPTPPPIEDKEPSSSHDETEEEDDDTSSEETKPPSKTPQSPKPACSDSGTGSDTPVPSHSNSNSNSNPKSKSLTSKPIVHALSSIPKLPKPKSASKRPSDAKSNGDTKRAKKDGKASASGDTAAVIVNVVDNGEEAEEAEEDGAKKAVGDPKKLFQRIWSEEDEIAILKGMFEFIAERGLDPWRHADTFYDFVKKSVHVEASCNQLKEKIRRMKKKFMNNLGRGKNGKDPNFTKPFDQETFELSKKIWGNVNEGSGKDLKISKSDAAGKHVKTRSRKDRKKIDTDNEIDTSYVTSYIMGLIQSDKGVGLYGVNNDMLKGGIELIKKSKRKELEGQWKEVGEVEMELSVKRAELLSNYASLALEAYKSSH